MHVSLKNPRSGEVRKVKVGWSWVLFFWSGLFGLPLFLRRLYVWGSVFLVLWVVNLIGPGLMANEDEGVLVSLVLFFIFLGLQIWLGVKGNEMTAKNYLDLGWVFAEPEAPITQTARQLWRIA